jgi:hypothetical protein
MTISFAKEFLKYLALPVLFKLSGIQDVYKLQLRIDIFRRRRVKMAEKTAPQYD